MQPFLESAEFFLCRVSVECEKLCKQVRDERHEIQSAPRDLICDAMWRWVHVAAARSWTYWTFYRTVCGEVDH